MANSGGGGGGGGGGDGGGGGGGAEESEDTLTTQLDRGQAFAEPPAFQHQFGSIVVDATALRDTDSTAVPIEFRVSNPSTTPVEDVAMSIAVQIMPGSDPEDPPVPPA